MTAQLEPFVGPRPFEREDEKYFFGRDQTASELVSLILAYPTVVLYAQSGAGKTSLLKAKVLSVLEDQKGFDVPPIARVRSQGISTDANSANVYVANALRDLSDNSLSADRMTQLSFADYLAERPRSTPKSESEEEDEAIRPRVLIFDQFEELFTLHPERYNDRKEFFKQLRDALEQDSMLRVVFSMREDYIAELDPYTHILPDSLRTRFRLERLRKTPAVNAVLGPFSRFNHQMPEGKRIEINKEVAEALIDSLRTIKVHSDAGEVEFKGEFVEPVHLQIVCKALLEKMIAEGKGVITDRELEEFGNVNNALAEYFERAIEKASQKGVDEAKLRRWFNEVVITPENTRSTVLRGRTHTAGIPNSAIDVLAAERLIRSETRDNREWYELSHDKLIEPIRSQWLLKQGGDEQLRLSFIKRATDWLASHRTDNSLLLTTTAEIETVKRWTNHEADGYNQSLAALVDASQAAIDSVEQQRAQALALERQRAAEAEAEAQRQKAAAEKLRAEQAEAAARAAKRESEHAAILAERTRREADQAALFAAKQAHSAARLRLMVVILAFMFLLSLAFGGFAFRQTTVANAAVARAEQQRIIAEQRLEEATAAIRFARDKERFAAYQQMEAEKQRELAERLAKQAEDKAELARLAEQKAAKASEDAKLQKTLAVSSTAAARAELLITQQPREIESSVRQALASLALNTNSFEGDQALRHGMALLPQLVRRIEFVPSKVAFTPDGNITAFTSFITALFGTDGQEKNQIIELQKGVRLIMSDDGRYVAAIGKGEAKIINLTDRTERIASIFYGKKPGEVFASDDDSIDATLSPDGKYLAILVSNSLRVWEVKTSGLVKDISVELSRSEEPAASFLPAASPPPAASSPSVAISQNNAFVIVTGGQKFSIYKIEDGKQMLSAKRARLDRQTLGSNYLATSVVDEEAGALVRVQNLTANNSPIQWLTPGVVEQLAFSPDESMLATVIGNQVTVWNTESGREITRVGHTVDVKSVVFSQHNNLLATTGEDRTTRLWNLRTGRERFRMGHNKDVRSVSFSPDERFLVTGSDDLRLWNVSAAGVGLDLSLGETLDQAIISHNGKHLAVFTYDKSDPFPIPVGRRKQLTIFDTLTGDVTWKLPPRRILKAVFSLNDDVLLIAGTHRIEARSIVDGKLVTSYNFDGGLMNNVEFSAHRRYVVAGIIERGVKMLDLSGEEPIESIPFRDSANSEGYGRVALSKDGEKVFYQDRSGTYFGWDKKSDEVFRIAKGFPFGTTSVKTSPDGRYFAFQAQIGGWKIYDTKELKPVLAEETQKGLRSVSFSNNGKYLVLALRSDNLVKVYNLPSLIPKAQFSAESTSTQISFSYGEEYVASGGGGLVQIWSLPAGREVTRVQFSGSLRALDFSSDNKYIMTASTDRSVRLTLLRTSDLMDLACKRTSGSLTKAEWISYFSDEPYRRTCTDQK